MNKDWGEIDHDLPPKSWPNSSWRCDTNNCDLNCMFYADNSQVYVSINPNHPKNDALDTLQQCVEHIFSWNSYAQE